LKKAQQSRRAAPVFVPQTYRQQEVAVSAILHEQHHLMAGTTTLVSLDNNPGEPGQQPW